MARHVFSIASVLALAAASCGATQAPGAGVATTDITDAAANPDAPVAVTSDPMDAHNVVDLAKADRRVVDARPRPDIYYAPVTCSNNLLFCEDFDFGDVNPTRWMPIPSLYYGKELTHVTIDFDAGPLARGKRSLRVTGTTVVNGEAEARDGFLRTIDRFPLGSATLFLRFFIFIDESTPNRWYTVFFVSDPAKDRQLEDLYEVKVVPVSETMASASAFRIGSAPTPTGGWSCWEIEIQGAQKKVLLYVDGKQIRSADQDIADSPANVQLNFGMLNGHADIIKHPGDGFFHIRFDDIAVSKERIGCSP